MIDNITRLGVDLGAPTLVAFAVVALVAGLLGMAVGSLLELLRTRRLARRELMNPVTYDSPAYNAAYDAPVAPVHARTSAPSIPSGYEAHSLAWAAPKVLFSEPGPRWASPSGSPSGAGLGAEIFSESGLEDWYTGAKERSGGGWVLAGLVTFAILTIAASLGVGVLLLQRGGLYLF